jgi:type I restriction enzyme S subunit
MMNLPDTWKDYSFGDIVTFSGGAQPPRNTFKFEPQEGYLRLIQTRDYKSNKYITYIPEKLARKKCKKDDIMIGRYGPPIFQILRGLEGAYNVALLKAIPDEKQLKKEYLFYYISQYKVWAFVENLSQRSGGQTGVDLVQLRKYPFPLPPLPEQQKIVRILSSVDEKIENVDQQITAIEQLKQGMMQRLLTKGIGHAEFKNSPLGKIPKSWDVVTVGAVSKLQGGFAFKSSDSTDRGIRWVKIANVGVHKIKWEDESFLPFGFVEKHPEFVLNTGDIVIAMTRPILSGKLKIAKIREYDSGSLLNQRVGRVQIIGQITSDFAYQTFNSTSFINLMEKELVGTDPPNISSKMFEELLITLPPLDEQIKISQILETIDSKKILLLEKKYEYTELKKGLMQQLLTGKKRVQL